MSIVCNGDVIFQELVDFKTKYCWQVGNIMNLEKGYCKKCPFSVPNSHFCALSALIFHFNKRIVKDGDDYVKLCASFEDTPLEGAGPIKWE